VLFAGLGSSFSSAQDGIVDCVMQKKLLVSRVQGRVFDPSGVPVPGAQIALSREGAQQIQSKTDAKGEFTLRVPSGSYRFKAKLQGFEVTEAELEVGNDLANLARPTALKVILALPGMNCPWVTASNKEFKELVRQHATQK
jgi:hypothetical protein